MTKVQQNFPMALKLQCIPEDRELWKLENFEKFLAARRRMLADELNAYLEKITKTADTEVETPLEELIVEGESADLEFKSSLRWSYEGACIDKRLEDAVVKSIAAFSNGDGGTLLIGVSDDDKILGLEHDYTSLDGNKDEFELHLRDLINKSLGVGFAVKNLGVSFHLVDGKEVCKIEIKKAETPQYLAVADKGGNKSDKLYVRSGNSSIELPLKDVASYIKSRFG